MFQEKLDNLNNPKKAGTERCSICKELLIHLEQFFNMIETSRRPPASDWLTVDDIAKELKVSKSIVYRLIRNCQIEAINVAENNGKIAQKGHYRINKKSLKKYIEANKVKPLPEKTTHSYRQRTCLKVKNHLGL